MRNGMFAPWEGWRKALGGVAAAFMVLLVIAFSIPLGIVAVGAMFLAAQIWKSPMDSPNYDRMQYTMMTRSYRVALFFVTVKQQAAVLFSPVILLGAGPPREDPDHDLQPGFWPPFRLSSWWSMLGALALAPLEILISPMRMSVIGGSLPWFIATALAIPGWYAFFQVLADARRLAPDKDAGALGDPPPATMLNKIDDHIELHPSLIRSATFGAIPVVIVIILWITVKWPWWVTLIAVILSFTFTAAILWSRNLMTEYRSAWVEREALAENWQSIWMSLLPVRAGSPLFSNEFDLPSVDEFEAELARWHREMDESDDLDASPPEYEVLVKCANFRYAPGQTYETVAGMTEGLRGALNAGLV
ncbi:MAG TPA: hypothetical protein VFC06_06785, partial [Demequina sp.]|nr:hypothetical protein [Demequina sp.]